MHRLLWDPQHLVLLPLCDNLLRATVSRVQYPAAALRKTPSLLLVIHPQGLLTRVFRQALARAPLFRLLHHRAKSLRHAHGFKTVTVRLRSGCPGHRHCSCRIRTHQRLRTLQQARSPRGRKRFTRLCPRTRTCSSLRPLPGLQRILCRFSGC